MICYLKDMKLLKLKFKIIKNNCNKSFLYRISLYLKKGSIKLHIITGDDSKVFHTHPWNFTSFILFGGYKEQTKPLYLCHFDTYGYIQSSIIELYSYETKKYRIFSINRKKYNEEHRVELFRLFGIKIPCITIGFYSNKIELCSFCKELGYCKSNKPLNTKS